MRRDTARVGAWWLPGVARRACRGAIAGLAGALALAGLGHPASAAPRAIEARVIWAAGDRAYVATTDSLALAPGVHVTLMERRRPVAGGDVERVMDGRVASLRITIGSLAKIRRLDRLGVLAEGPPPRALPRLRVGIPGGTRENLVVACDTPAIAWPGGTERYRVEALPGQVWRGVRDAPATDSEWPDTLEVRTFRDATDEEIALQRGEIDVAVFWPGELSARIREHPGDLRLLRGIRASGIVAIEDPSTRPTAPPGAFLAEGTLASLNATLFGGDLLPWPERPAAGASDADSTPSPPAPGRPFTVRATLPGRAPIEHHLNGGASLFVRGKPSPVPITRLEVPLAAADSLAADWSAAGIVPLFALRCPVLCAPGAAAAVERIGAGRFADLARCEPAGGRP